MRTYTHTTHLFLLSTSGSSNSAYRQPLEVFNIIDTLTFYLVKIGTVRITNSDERRLN